MLNKIKSIVQLFFRKVELYIHYYLKEKLCDKKYFENIIDKLEEIPLSNGVKYYVPYNTKVAIIADEFLFNSFNNIADFIYITPDNYMEHCDDIEILLVVSTWRGLNNEWRYMATKGTPANEAVYKTIDYYKKNNKKIVFYSKEDPPNYDHFLPIAKCCDIIFTSAEERVSFYKKDCNTNKVFVLKFGINPLYHNPIGCRIFKKSKDVVFSGSWVKKYPQRIKEQDAIFKGILKSGYQLKIIDRNFELDNWGFLFPFRYYKFISPSIPHEYLQKVHKLYDWAVNVNSVKDSRTMFANRVYELSANGNLLISNDSIGVREQFKDIFIVNNSKDVISVLKSLNTEEIYEKQMSAVRYVMAGETTFDRVGEILFKAGYPLNQPTRKVLVIAYEITTGIINNFNLQTYPYKKLIIREEFDPKYYEDYDMVTFWREDRCYKKFYLEDMINGFKYTNCDYITKNSYIEKNIIKKGKEHNYTNKIDDIYCTIFWNNSFSYKEILQLINQEEIISIDNGYSIDYLNYVVL